MTLLNLAKVKSILWGNDPKDAALLIKLDFTILPYFSLIWFLFGLSRSSYSSAYISGMKEALDFKGNDFNYLNTTYLVVYAVCQMPGTSLLTIAPPKCVFVSANVAWSVLTLITFRMNHVWQIILLNAFEGGFSAIAYVGAHFIYATWYKKTELGTRAAVFVSFGHLGSWIFIPGLPSHRNAWYLVDEEREHAATRLGQPRKYTWDKTVFKRVLLSWQFWLLPTIFMLYSLAIQMELNNVFPLWMASRGYTVVQQNNYPTALYGTAIVGTIFYSVLSDKIQSRWQCSLAIGFTFVVGSAILIANPHADSGHFFAFYLLGTAYAPQALWYSWMADVTAHDFQLRAITTGFMNSFDFAFVTWWPLIFYPVTNAPEFRKGYIASIVTGALLLPLVLVIAYLERRGMENGTLGRDYDDELDSRDESSAGEADVVDMHLPGKM
ncbi:Pantothenate transporter liz1 [Hyphodiscus hymeniophilus]|uniref:Pantothenate transporter liz1 n=1 Tax=Hyphodiscus hymeniophilus TaxID=353542 RepID=A0A9P6VI88_9HELO|nr:Pantothenate transporter liz1 [Hyphodiscus hymeniophilus]